MPAPNLAVGTNSPSDISDKLNFIAGRIQRLGATGRIPDNDADTTGNAATATLADRALEADHATAADSATLAAAATKLQTARAINGVNFDGTAPITVTAAAGTLTGTALNGTITSSFLNRIAPLVAYANNAAAVAAGEAVGNLYRTGGDPDTVCVVH